MPTHSGELVSSRTSHPWLSPWIVQATALNNDVSHSQVNPGAPKAWEERRGIGLPLVAILSPCAPSHCL